MTMKKQEYTQLGWRFERMSDHEKELNPHLLSVKVNYRKCASDVVVDLRELNPLYNENTESLAEIYYPVILLPRWIPRDAIYTSERRICISFMFAWPSGTPDIQELEPWAERYRAFTKDMKKRYPRSHASESYIFEEWQRLLQDNMPTVRKSQPGILSDDIVDYMLKKVRCFSRLWGSTYTTRILLDSIAFVEVTKTRICSCCVNKYITFYT